MRANDPIFAGTQCLELWRHDDDDDEPDGCHIGLYYRSNGKHDIYEMHLGDEIVPLHPDFPVGFILAAHCLLHIAENLYDGTLVTKTARTKPDEDTSGLKKLLDEWKDAEENGRSGESPAE